jgi:thiamine pyrophosphate-dependent acetolactate synthase large subunit-like protein
MTGQDGHAEADKSGAASVGITLTRLGVRQVFGVVGSGNFVVTDAMVRHGARYVAARHEAGAAGMADGYFRSTGRAAVCSVHQGPGLTNAVTAITEAAKSRVPMVVVAGATSAGMTRSNFYLDQSRLAQVTGAATETVHRVETIALDTTRAFDRAMTEQRPVVLNLPLDVQAATTTSAAGPRRATRVTAAHPAADVVEELSEHLRRARRPLILAGRGAWRSGARKDLMHLADQVGALLATTAVAKGLFTGHGRDLGVAGGFSSDEVARLMETADLVLGFGCSFTQWTTRSNHVFSDNTVVVQIDADADALALNRRVDLGVVGDAALTARALLERAGAGAPSVSEWLDGAPEMAPAREAATTSRDGLVHPAQLTCVLEGLLPEQRTVVMDGGHFIGWPATGLSVPDPSGFLFSSAGFQSIGLGLGLAAGAALGRPDRLTVLTVGDGGFMMSLVELDTLVRQSLPVLVVVYNDAAYGAEVHHFNRYGSGMELVQFPATDIASVARGFGAEATTVRDVADLAAVEGWLAEPRGPHVVDARIDPTVVGHWAAQDFVGH